MTTHINILTIWIFIIELITTRFFNLPPDVVGIGNLDNLQKFYFVLNEMVVSLAFQNLVGAIGRIQNMQKQKNQKIGKVEEHTKPG